MEREGERGESTEQRAGGPHHAVLCKATLSLSVKRLSPWRRVVPSNVHAWAADWRGALLPHFRCLSPAERESVRVSECVCVRQREGGEPHFRCLTPTERERVGERERERAKERERESEPHFRGLSPGERERERERESARESGGIPAPVLEPLPRFRGKLSPNVVKPASN